MTDRIYFASAGAVRRTSKPHPTDYAPYHTLPAFDEGITAYMENRYTNPYGGEPRQSVAAQAWDRGLAYAARVVHYSNK